MKPKLTDEQIELLTNNLAETRALDNKTKLLMLDVGPKNFTFLNFEGVFLECTLIRPGFDSHTVYQLRPDYKPEPDDELVMYEIKDSQIDIPVFGRMFIDQAIRVRGQKRYGNLWFVGGLYDGKVAYGNIGPIPKPPEDVSPGTLFVNDWNFVDDVADTELLYPTHVVLVLRKGE